MNVTVKDNICTITFDVTANLGPSKSGKTVLVATTGGNKLIPGTDVMLGMNAYKVR